MSDLKPCPFCGGKAMQHSHQKGSPSAWEFDCDYWICCETEDCAVHVGMCDTSEAAIAAWNRRAPTFTAADLEAAFRLGRDMAVKIADRYANEGQWVDGSIMAADIATAIRALTPPADLADRVKGGGE